VIGVVFFVQRRRRRAGPKSVLSSTDSREAGSHAIVTPFDPNLNSPEETRDTGTPPEQQPLVDEKSDTEMVAPHRLSSSPPISTVLPLPQPVEPVPVGLSDKEIARLRAHTLGSRQSQTRSGSTPNVLSQPETTSSANAATQSGEASSSYDTRRLHSEVESLRREMERLRDMERLRAEGLGTEAPPRYTEGDR
jgi:hypothetical protein